MLALVYPHTDQRDEKGVTLTDTHGGPQEDYDEKGVSTLDHPNLEPRLSRRDQRRLGTGKVKRLLHAQALKLPDSYFGLLDDAIDGGAEHRPKAVLGINVRLDPEATRPEADRGRHILLFFHFSSFSPTQRFGRAILIERFPPVTSHPLFYMDLSNA